MASDVQARLDPTKSNFVTIVGKKGSGKSVLATYLWRSYPFDRIVIDPTGDVDAGPDARRLTDPLPGRFPTDPEGKRVSLRYVPDPGSLTYLDDMDRMVGLALFHPHRRCLLWVDEVGEITKHTKTPPNFSRALHQGRHRRLSMIMCGPRPVKIDPLVLSQADLVYVFRLPNPRDRERVAETIGWPPAEFDAAVTGLGQYHYLRYDAGAAEPGELADPAEQTKLVEFPALPALARRREPDESAGEAAAGLF